MKEQQRPAISLEHVSKSFGEKHVLRDVSLPIREGEAVCLLGRSGTGKSVDTQAYDFPAEAGRGVRLDRQAGHLTA